MVALLAEGVDKNILNPLGYYMDYASPSSRRAWIEIVTSTNPDSRGTVALLAEGVDKMTIGTSSSMEPRVALLAEGVDRNKAGCWNIWQRAWSPSSRRAWIEISC